MQPRAARRLCVPVCTRGHPPRLAGLARPLVTVCVAVCRVVLDEAQSIKNPRTLAARAAWRLYAHCRWCLSGTPIQNGIDDLYSYFKCVPHAHVLPGA